MELPFSVVRCALNWFQMLVGVKTYGLGVCCVVVKLSHP